MWCFWGITAAPSVFHQGHQYLQPHPHSSTYPSHSVVYPSFPVFSLPCTAAPSCGVEDETLEPSERSCCAARSLVDDGVSSVNVQRSNSASVKLNRRFFSSSDLILGPHPLLCAAPLRCLIANTGGRRSLRPSLALRQKLGLPACWLSR